MGTNTSCFCALPPPHRPVHPLARAVSDVLAEPQTGHTARSLLSVQVDNAVPDRNSSTRAEPDNALHKVLGRIGWEHEHYHISHDAEHSVACPPLYDRR